MGRSVGSYGVSLLFGFGLLACSAVNAQTTNLPSVDRALQENVLSSSVSTYQMQQFLMARIPALAPPATAGEWTVEAARLRKELLEEIAYHGWPREWIDAAPHFEQVAVIESGRGYRIHKFRYDIVPGFVSSALLYEPTTGKWPMPAVLNVLGHEPDGTAAEYEQKRCINLAKRGIVALNLQWPGFGELAQLGNRHDYGAQLDLVGANVLGFHYLAMRRGLDYLANQPEVDRARIGMTGLSGGGWQTVILSALDPRIAASVEVAGIGSRESNLARPHDTDEVEEGAPDIMRKQDYPYFIAMRAPRPTLLIHNATDSCCFRAPLVKPYVYDNVMPFFSLFHADDALQWHENVDPGTHNYQRDNREQAYAFFSKEFHLPLSGREIFSDDEIRTPEELAVQMPEDNLTTLELARRFAAATHRDAVPGDESQRAAWIKSQRGRLKSVLRYEPVTAVQVTRRGNGIGLNFHYLTYRFDLSNGLSATGVWLQENSSPQHRPAVLVLSDKGFSGAASLVAQHVDRGDQVLALNLLFIGPDAPGVPDTADWTMLSDGAGVRALGLEVAQLIAAATWLKSNGGIRQIQVQTDGIRNQMIALTAAALEPDLFSSITSQDGMRSLAFLLDTPVPIRSAPELFCLDLYKQFDIDTLQALAAPVKISITTLASPEGPWSLKRYTD